MFRTTISFIMSSWFTVFCSSAQTVTVCTELQNTVNHELLMMNEMVVRNMYSCTKIVQKIHTEGASCWFVYIIGYDARYIQCQIRVQKHSFVWSSSPVSFLNFFADIMTLMWHADSFSPPSALHFMFVKYDNRNSQKRCAEKCIKNTATFLEISHDIQLQLKSGMQL